MSHLPAIIGDLAMILLVAGITTILFKKLRQPLVLGYIIAGFITGPHFQFFPTVSDNTSIQTWSEIGVIFLMFALGLEFSFYKLKSVGSKAFIATGIAVGGMIITGYCAGMLLGWSHMNSIFLGGMLSMSSTAIIFKAFDDLQLKNQRFAQFVFAMLIIEDIAGIVMMVMLSTLAAATGSATSSEMLDGIGKLVFCLVLWFVLGMYLVPTFFKKTRSLMNDETLLVASIGLCLSMVVVATHMGFSSALGAFIMGSLIAEAPDAERIERLVAPVKDLFSAVFFVSVGMMVDPALLLEYAVPVIILILVTIIGQITFATLGVLASGNNLYNSMRCGFSLCQIGEFSFILATLGISLGITSDFLYPIIVAVSVITTFTTPFCIKAAEPAYSLAQRLLPEKFIVWLDRHTEKAPDNDSRKKWNALLQIYILRMLIFLTLLIAIGSAAQLHLLPYLTETLRLPYSNLITAAATFLVMSPILRAVLVNRAGNAELFSVLWFENRANHIPLVMLLLGKLLVAAGALAFIFHGLAGFHPLITVPAILLAGYFISTSDWLMGEYLRIESRFLVNMNEKHIRRHREMTAGSGEEASWFDEDLQLVSYKVEKGSPFIGKNLLEIGLRVKYGCNVLQIRLGDRETDFPGASAVIREGAELLLIGTRANVYVFDSAVTQRNLLLTRLQPPCSLRQFMLDDKGDGSGQQFVSCAITIDRHSPLLRTSIKAANIRDRWHCLVLGLERGSYTIVNPNVSLVFEENDLLWVLGKQKMMNALIREQIL